jgi:hypothetical protein
MWPTLLGETADQAHELADLLGDHHDLLYAEKPKALLRRLSVYWESWRED